MIYTSQIEIYIYARKKTPIYKLSRSKAPKTLQTYGYSEPVNFFNDTVGRRM